MASLSPIPSPPEESDRPFPPRFWWLKRGVALFVLMLVALSALRWWWGREADRRLRAEIAAAQARGEPVLPEDFQTPESNVDTADKALSIAANRFVEVKQSGWLASHDQLPLSDRALKEIATAVAVNRESLDALRRARSLPIVSWGAPLGGELPPALPHGVATRQGALARLLRWKALSVHQAGDDREAADLVLDLLRQERVLDHGPPTLIVHLSALVADGRATDCIREIAPTVVITDKPVAGGVSSPATKEQIHQIIRDLLDDNDSRHAGVRAWYEIRMMDLHVAKNAGRMAPEDGGTLLRPMRVLDCMRIARIWGRIATAAAQPNWPAAGSQFPPDETRAGIRDYSSLELASRVLSLLYLPKIEPRVREQYRALAGRRMAAISLAIRLYESDHNGRYSASLDKLVPTYLPSVPVDPMAAGSRPITYRPDAKPPIIYSVGNNGKDDGGVTGADWRDGPDAVYPLGPVPQSAPVIEGSGSRAKRTPRPR